MKRIIVSVLLLTAPLAAKEDPRLATAKSAFVEAADALSDDRPIAACLSEHLAKQMPLEIAASKESADLILRVVKGNISGDSSRSMLGSMGLAHLEARLPDGTKIWDGYENASASNKLDMRPVAEVPCLLADALADKLRQAMKKARDKK